MGGLLRCILRAIRGKCCAFFCSAFFRRLGLCFSKVRPEDIFSDVVGEKFRVRTCTGSVLSGVVVDFNMEYPTFSPRKTPRQQVLFFLALRLLSSSLHRGTGVQSFVGRTPVL